MHPALANMRIKLLDERYKFDAEELNVDTLLDYAITASNTARDVGPFDPAFKYFTQQSIDFLNAADAIETLASVGRSYDPNMTMTP